MTAARVTPAPALNDAILSAPMISLWRDGGKRKSSGWHTYINVTRPKARTVELIDTATLNRRRYAWEHVAKGKPVPLDDPEATARVLQRALERNPHKVRCYESALAVVQTRAAMLLRATNLACSSSAFIKAAGGTLP